MQYIRRSSMLAVVHPVAGEVALDVGHVLDALVVEVEQRVAVAEGQGQAAVIRRHGGAHRLADVDRAVVAACGVEEMDSPRRDVHPQQPLPVREPARTFGQLGSRSQRQFHLRHVSTTSRTHDNGRHRAGADEGTGLQRQRLSWRAAGRPVAERSLAARWRLASERWRSPRGGPRRTSRRAAPGRAALPRAGSASPSDSWQRCFARSLQYTATTANCQTVAWPIRSGEPGGRPGPG